MANEVTINVKARDQGATAGLNRIKSNFTRMLSGLKGVAAAAGADLAASIAAPATVAVAGLATELVGAGAALGAFGLAVKPQVTSITDLATAQDAYNKAVLKSGAGSEQAKAAAKLFNDQLNQLPPATQDAAKGFLSLRSTFKRWSDSLAGTTMPIFTRGMRVLQGIIPKLTPLVKTAAGSLDDFMTSIEGGVRGGGLDRFLGQLNRIAAASLPHLLRSVRNVAVGVGHLFMAFAPLTSGSMIGGIERLTARFANWAKSLRGNPEFERFIRQMQANLPGIFTLLGNLLLIFGRISAALLPFSGLTLKVAEAFAALVAAIPQDVMNWLAPTIAGIVLAIRAWAVVQGVLNLALAANPIGLVVIAIAALAAGLVLAYRRSETFRNIVKGAFDAVKDAVSGLKDKAGPAVEAIANFFTDTLPQAFDEGIGKLLEITGKVDEAVAKVKESLAGLSTSGGGSGPGGGGKKKGMSPLAWFAAGVASDAIVIVGKVRKLSGDIKKWVVRNWTGKVSLSNLGGVRGVATAAKDAALGFARRAYRALLRADFPGAGVVKAAVRSAVRFAKGSYRATLRVLDRATGFARTIMSRLRGILSTITVAVRVAMPRIPGFNRLGGVARKQAGGNTTLVGEEGPELVDLPPGAYVRPEATTRARMLQQGGRGMQGPIVLQVMLDSKVVAEAVFDPMRGIIRRKGGKGPGSVQKALGWS